MTMSEQETELRQIVKFTKDAFTDLSGSSIERRNAFLKNLASSLDTNRKEIVFENKKDLKLAVENNLSEQLQKRLVIDDKKINTLIEGLQKLSKLQDPLNETTMARELDQGLNLYRVTCPIGLICIIFESRPESIIQITSLAIKSGNTIILKGGKEAENSNKMLIKIIKSCLEQLNCQFSSNIVNLIQTREEIAKLLKYEDLIDLIIPRGSSKLVKYIKNNTNISVLGHADGICHIYIDEDIQNIKEKIIDICLDSKTEYPAVCNACESILISKNLSQEILKELIIALCSKGVAIHADPSMFERIKEIKFKFGELKVRGDIMRKLYEKKNIEKDTDLTEIFKKEYLTLDVSLIEVSGLDESIEHINKYGSHHTDCILSENETKINKFCLEVDSANVFVNCSTRFADGFRYGFGAEVGVSTNKLHARGPVGMDGLITYKYKCVGNGHIVAPYNQKEKVYTHRNIMKDIVLETTNGVTEETIKQKEVVKKMKSEVHEKNPLAKILSFFTKIVRKPAK